jgi:hypothetical protein
VKLVIFFLLLLTLSCTKKESKNNKKQPSPFLTELFAASTNELTNPTEPKDYTIWTNIIMDKEEYLTPQSEEIAKIYNKHGMNKYTEHMEFKSRLRRHYKCYEQDFDENGNLVNLPLEKTYHYQMYQLSQKIKEQVKKNKTNNSNVRKKRYDE